MSALPIRTLHLTVNNLLYREAILFQLLKVQGIQIVGESSLGSETLEILRHRSAEILILEEGLDDNDGLTIAEIALSNLPGLNVILLVEKPVRESRMAIYLEAGLKCVVPKSASIRDLMRALSYVRNGQVYVDPVMHWGKDRGSQKSKGVALSVLSEREQAVASLMAQYKSIKDIAKELGVSQKTVHTYKDRILVKMDMECLQELILYLSRMQRSSTMFSHESIRV